MCMYRKTTSIYKYTSYELTAMKILIQSTGICTFHITDICPYIYACNIAHICPSALLLQSKHRPNITAYFL